MYNKKGRPPPGPSPPSDAFHDPLASSHGRDAAGILSPNFPTTKTIPIDPQLNKVPTKTIPISNILPPPLPPKPDARSIPISTMVACARAIDHLASTNRLIPPPLPPKPDTRSIPLGKVAHTHILFSFRFPIYE